MWGGVMGPLIRLRGEYPMQKSNLLPAVGAGFGLIVREPLSVLAWGLVYGVLTLGPLALFFSILGPGLIDFYRSAMTDPQSLSASPPAALMQAQAIQPLQLLGGLAAASIIYPAIFRAVLTPEDRRWAYLRLGKTELFVAVILIVLFVLLFVAMFIFLLVMIIPIGIGVGLAAGSGNGGMGVGMALLIFPLGLAAMIAFAYVFGRLWMGAPMTVAQRELRLFEGWTLTRGYGWSLVGMIVVIVLIVLVFELLLIVALGAIGFASLGGVNGIEALFTADRWRTLIGPLIAGYLGFAFVIATVMQPIMIAPWARAYQLIAGDKDVASGEVFA